MREKERCLHPASRFAFLYLALGRSIFLFSDGRTYPVSIHEASLAQELSESLFFEDFIAKYRASECANVILDMIRFGSIELLISNFSLLINELYLKG